MSELKIGPGASLQDIQKFTDQLGDDSKVRGKVNQDGTITLYTSTKSDWGIREFLTGHVTRRQEGAKQGLEMLVSQLQNDPKIGDGAKQLLTDIKAKLPSGAGELRGSEFRQLMQESIKARNEGLSFENRVVEAIKNQDRSELNTCRDKLALTLSESMRKLPHEEQIRLAASNGESYMDNVAFILGKSIGGESNPFGLGYEQSTDEGKQFLDDVYQKAMTQLSDRILNDTQIQVDGKVYTKLEQIGKGGYGAIDLYEAEDKSQIVIKRPLVDEGKSMKDKFDEASQETLVHLQTMGEGSENVIALKSAMRTEDGGLVIAMEKAPYGNCSQVSFVLDEYGLKENLIPKEIVDLAKTTMLKDMIEGMKHMDERGVTHSDVKPLNFLLGDGGKAKVSDFGTSETSRVVNQTTRMVDCPIWLAPEVMSGHDKLNSIINEVDDLLSKAKPIEELRQEFAGKISDSELETLLQRVTDDREKRTEDVKTGNPVTFTNKVDSWSLGVTAHQYLIGGDPLTDTNFSSKREEIYKEFGGDENRRVFEAPEGGKLTPQQELINDLMRPKPESRISPNEALESKVFEDERIGGDKIREFLSDPIFKEIHDGVYDRKLPTNEQKDRLRELARRYMS